MCPRDQSIINVLHSFREKYGYEGPSPVMLLPCRWSLFPAAEWQPHWNTPEEWLPELRARRRFPGIVSLNRVEIYCPDVADMLSAWGPRTPARRRRGTAPLAVRRSTLAASVVRRP